MDRYAMLVLLFAAFAAAESKAWAQDDKAKKRISVSDLTSNYEIVGPLGEPIGELMTVEAKCDKTPRKHGGKGAVLVIQKLNGKQLPTPVVISYSIYPWANIDQLRHAETYTLRGYQDATFHGIPAGVMDETVPVQMPYRFELHCYFKVINQLHPVVPARHPGPLPKP